MLGVNSDRVGSATGPATGPVFSPAPYRFTVDDADAVLRHCRAIREEQRITVGLGRLELVRTQEVLRRRLPPPPARVLDVRGATGVHASWLAGDGYHVHVVDPTPRHVEMVRSDLGSRGVTAHLGEARNLTLADRSFDVVLLLGPLYHLTDGAERRQALREAIRVGWLDHLADAWDSTEGREAILHASRAVESEPTRLGLSAHLLAVTRAPA